MNSDFSEVGHIAGDTPRWIQFGVSGGLSKTPMFTVPVAGDQSLRGHVSVVSGEQAQMLQYPVYP